MPAMIRRRWRVAPHRRTRTSMIAAAALVLLLAVAGSACSSSNSSGSTTSTMAAANAEAVVRETLEGWVEAFSRARADPAGDHRDLLRYGSADFVQKQQPLFNRLMRDGQRIARPADSKYMFKVLSVTTNGAHSSARTCFVDDVSVMNARSGAFVERDTATFTEIWFLEHVGQRWLISRTQGQHELPGAKPCPAQ